MLKTKIRRLNLKKIFTDAAVGGITALTVKSAFTAAAACAGAPVTGAAILGSAAAGATVRTGQLYWQHRKQHGSRRRFGENPQKFWTKETRREVLKSAVTAGLFGGLFVGLADLVNGCFSAQAPAPEPIELSTPEPSLPPALPEPPELKKIPEPAAGDQTPAPSEDPPQPELSQTEKMLAELQENADCLQADTMAALDQYITDNDITNERFLAIFEAAKNCDAQAMKDLASIINTEGEIFCIDLPKDAELVNTLYQSAMAQGNQQAMVDWAYLQHFGQNNLEPDPATGIELMKYVMENADNNEIRDVASCFYEQWTEGYDGRDCIEVTGCDTPSEDQTPVKNADVTYRFEINEELAKKLKPGDELTISFQ